MFFWPEKLASVVWFRKLLIVLITIFTVIGIVSCYSFFRSTPQVGYFRSAAGRSQYVTAYEEAFKSLPAPTKTHDLTTDFGSVRAYEWYSTATKDSVPVVLVPGKSSGVPMWSENLKFFAEHHRVIAFDGLGDAGLSVQSAPMTTMADMASWMNQAITQLAPEGAHIVGHSFGGAIATAYATYYPQHTRSLSLLEPVFTFGYPPFRLMAWTMVAAIPGLPQSWRQKALGKVGGTSFDGVDPMGQMIEAGAAEFSASLPTPSVIKSEQARNLGMPVYVAIASNESLAGGEKAAQHVHELIPHAQVRIWPNTTHSLPMQAAEPLTVELEDFWSQAEP